MTTVSPGMDDSSDHLVDDNLRLADPVCYRGVSNQLQEQAAAFDDFLSRHLPISVISWSCDDDGWRFEYEHVSVIVISNKVESLHVLASSEIMHRKYLDGMRQQLRSILDQINDVDLTPTGWAVKLLALCEEADVCQRMWYEESKAKSVEGTSTTKHDGWDAREVESWDSILDNPAGVNLATIQDTAQEILGKPLTEICSRISEKLRILHVEPVFRNDLLAKFLKKKAKIHQTLLDMPYQALRQSVSAKEIPRGSREVREAMGKGHTRTT
jgi:hypothetical protein